MMLAKKGGRTRKDESIKKRSRESEEVGDRRRKRTEKEYRPKKMSRRKVRLVISFVTTLAVVVSIIAAVFLLYSPEDETGYNEKSVDGSAVKMFVLSKETGWDDEWFTEVQEGSAVTVQLQLQNTGDERGGYRLECKDLPSGWSAEFDNPLVTLDNPGQTENIKATVIVNEPGEATLKFTATSTEVEKLDVYVPVTINVLPYDKDEDGTTDR